MTEKPEEQMPSTSGETREVKELFDLKNFPHILDSDEEDFEDFERGRLRKRIQNIFLQMNKWIKHLRRCLIQKDSIFSN